MSRLASTRPSRSTARPTRSTPSAATRAATAASVRSGRRCSSGWTTLLKSISLADLLQAGVPGPGARRDRRGLLTRLRPLAEPVAVVVGPPVRSLSPPNFQRYSRHLHPVPARRARGPAPAEARAGAAGRRRRARLAGGALSRGGRGRDLGLVDTDRVDVTNLQRQVLHGTAAIGPAQSSTRRAARLADLNPHVAVEPFPERLTSANALRHLSGTSTSSSTAATTSPPAIWSTTPASSPEAVVYGEHLPLRGAALGVRCRRGPCYRCLFAEPPPAGTGAGLRRGGRARGAAGRHRQSAGDGGDQAGARRRRAAGRPAAAVRRARACDSGSWPCSEDPACPLCGDAPGVTELIDYDAFCGRRRSRGGAHRRRSPATGLQRDCGRPAAGRCSTCGSTGVGARADMRRGAAGARSPACPGWRASSIPRADIVTTAITGCARCRPRRSSVRSGFPRAEPGRRHRPVGRKSIAMGGTETD